MTTSLSNPAISMATGDVGQVEQLVKMPIVNPATGAKSRKMRFAGKLDLLQDGRIVDYKGVANPQKFIDETGMSFQAELYALASGGHIHEIEYRLITRPTIKYTPPTHKWAVVRAGRKTAVRVCETEEEAAKLAEAQGCAVEKRTNGYETRQQYEDACLDWLLEDRNRVRSHPSTLSSGTLEQARHFLWDCAQRVLHCRRHNQWLPNGRACSDYGRRCQFAEVCLAIKADADYRWILDEEFHVTDNPHPELGDDGRDGGILTYSSITVLTQCELKYWLLYEQCLRAGREESEPLWVGSAIHEGLAVYQLHDVDTAMRAIDIWSDLNPVLGPDAARRQVEQIAKARAMVRAAALKWPKASQPTTPCPVPTAGQAAAGEAGGFKGEEL